MATFNALRSHERDLHFFTNPKLWPVWPILPLIRRRPGNPADPELGVLYDAAGHAGIYGYSATVFLINLYCVPSDSTRLLAKPHYNYDTPEEMAAAGWTVD